MIADGNTIVGLICTMSPELHVVWGEAVRAPSRLQFAQARAALESFGLRVVDPGEYTTSYQKGLEHGRLLRSHGIQVLVVYVARWAYGTTIVASASEAGVPVIVWTGTDIVQVGIVGASVVRGSLDEAGIVNSLVYGDFDDPLTLKELFERCLGAAAACRLRGQRYGLMGYRSLGMLPAAIDANQ